MEVAWSKVGSIRRMLEDFPLEVSQRLIYLFGSMGTRVVMQEQQWEFMYTSIYVPFRVCSLSNETLILNIYSICL
jgi:hypothetical protein